MGVDFEVLHAWQARALAQNKALGGWGSGDLGPQEIYFRLALATPPFGFGLSGALGDNGCVHGLKFQS